MLHSKNDIPLRQIMLEMNTKNEGGRDSRKSAKGGKTRGSKPVFNSKKAAPKKKPPLLPKTKKRLAQETNANT